MNSPKTGKKKAAKKEVRMTAHYFRHVSKKFADFLLVDSRYPLIIGRLHYTLVK